MKASFYRLARIHHPDHVVDAEKAAAKEKFLILHQAYSILVNPDTKESYDNGASHTLFAKTTIAANGTNIYEQLIPMTWTADEKIIKVAIRKKEISFVRS